MSSFRRDISKALAQRYDLIVVGGGIYGMTLTLEAARRGLKALLVERNDFGSAASLSSLRVLHGGLRYLQDLDLPRFFESVEQRGWFMQHFAPLCRILPCLMPLYGRGLKRPGVFRIALAINDLLSRCDLGARGRVLDVEETLRRFPQVARQGLKGSALWYDGQILSPQRLHMELLRWAAELGATLLNYTEAIALERNGSRVAGLVTNIGTFFAPVVINAAGSWAREVATRLDQDHPELMVPSLTFNVVLDVAPPSDAAVAVQGQRMYFITPHRAAGTFVGTVHRAWEGLREPSDAMLHEFIGDLQAAVPQWTISRGNIVRVTSGVLPAEGPGKMEMAHRSTFVKHGVRGLFSICGIKYTTAQRFARYTVERIWGRRRFDARGPEIGDRTAYVDPDAVMALDDSTLLRLAEEEAVMGAEDFLERRIDWIPNPAVADKFAKRLEILLGRPNSDTSSATSRHA